MTGVEDLDLKFLGALVKSDKLDTERDIQNLKEQGEDHLVSVLENHHNHLEEQLEALEELQEE